MTYYIPEVPGENANADAYNLLAAALANDDMMADAVADHQVGDSWVSVLATMTAWLVLMLSGFRQEDTDHLLSHMREIAEASL